MTLGRLPTARLEAPAIRSVCLSVLRVSQRAHDVVKVERGGLGASLSCAAALASPRNPGRPSCRDRSDSTAVCAVAGWDRNKWHLWGFVGSFPGVPFNEEQLCFWQNRASTSSQVAGNLFTGCFVAAQNKAVPCCVISLFSCPFSRVSVIRGPFIPSLSLPGLLLHRPPCRQVLPCWVSSLFTFCNCFLFSPLVKSD